LVVQGQVRAVREDHVHFNVSVGMGPVQVDDVRVRAIRELDRVGKGRDSGRVEDRQAEPRASTSRQTRAVGEGVVTMVPAEEGEVAVVWNLARIEHARNEGRVVLVDGEQERLDDSLEEAEAYGGKKEEEAGASECDALELWQPSESLAPRVHLGRRRSHAPWS
jgi:hypothetical protein